jgi:hypothetical protein
MPRLNIEAKNLCKFEVIGVRYTQKNFDKFDLRNAKKRAEAIKEE